MCMLVSQEVKNGGYCCHLPNSFSPLFGNLKASITAVEEKNNKRSFSSIPTKG